MMDNQVVFAAATAEKCISLLTDKELKGKKLSKEEILTRENACRVLNGYFRLMTQVIDASARTYENQEGGT